MRVGRGTCEGLGGKEERKVLTIIMSKGKIKTVKANKQKKQKTVQPHFYPSAWKTKAGRYLRKRIGAGWREKERRGEKSQTKLQHLRENETLYQL